MLGDMWELGEHDGNNKIQHPHSPQKEKLVVFALHVFGKT
jgi:hypothetical protein